MCLRSFLFLLLGLIYTIIWREKAQLFFFHQKSSDFENHVSLRENRRNFENMPGKGEQTDRWRDEDAGRSGGTRYCFRPSTERVQKNCLLQRRSGNFYLYLRHNQGYISPQTSSGVVLQTTRTHLSWTLGEPVQCRFHHVQFYLQTGKPLSYWPLNSKFKVFSFCCTWW